MMSFIGVDVRIATTALIGNGVIVKNRSKIGEWTKLCGHVRIGEDVSIGDNVSLAGNITIGNNCVLKDGCHIYGNVTIGESCIIWNACIGGIAEHTMTAQNTPSGKIEIGDKCVIREFVTIHSSTVKDVTKIGNNCFLMVHSHLGHDVVLEDDVIISPGGKVGGVSRVMTGAYVGMDSTIHQNTTVGAYAMIGMGAVVVKDVPPFFTVIGNPAKFLQINERGMLRHGFSAEEISVLKESCFDMVTTNYSHLRICFQNFDQKRNRNRQTMQRWDK